MKLNFNPAKTSNPTQTFARVKITEETWKQILKMKNLKELHFIDCDLKKIPSEIKKLTHLKVLEITRTPLEELPEELCSLKRLEELYLVDTALENLPPKLKNLKALHVLSLMGSNQMLKNNLAPFRSRQGFTLIT